MMNTCCCAFETLSDPGYALDRRLADVSVASCMECVTVARGPPTPPEEIRSAGCQMTSCTSHIRCCKSQVTRRKSPNGPPPARPMSARGCVSRLPPWFSRCISRKLVDAAANDDDDDGVVGRLPFIAETTLLLTGADVARLTGGRGRGGC